MVSCNFFLSQITYVYQTSVLKVLILIVSTKFTYLRNYDYIFGEIIYLTANFVILIFFLIFSNFFFFYPNILKTLWESGCVFNGFLRVSEILKSQISFSDKLSVQISGGNLLWFYSLYQNNKKIDFYGKKFFQSSV